MRGPWLGVGLMTLVLAGCASTPPTPPAATTTPSPLIEGLLAAPDQQGLVATYIAGGCDGPARLVATETASRIDVSVFVGPDPNGPEPCAAIGIGRTVAVRLDQSIGTRKIFAGPSQQIPFDGARTLLPSSLPTGFTDSKERTGPEPASAPVLSGTSEGGPTSGTDAARVSTRWSVRYTQPQPNSVNNQCTTTRGIIAITVAPANTEDFSPGWSQVATVSLGEHPARLLRNGPEAAPTAWAYVWQANQGTIEVVAAPTCQGDLILTSAELLTVAGSLRSP